MKDINSILEMVDFFLANKWLYNATRSDEE